MLKNTLGWMAAALVCGGCSQPGSIVGMAPAELPMPKQIDVVFNHNARSRYRSPLTGEWRNGDDMEAWLIEAIDGATEEVLVAVQELSLPRVAQALIAAKHRGVLVQVILENNYRQAWSEQRPSRLNQRERQRWHQLNRLADSDRNGTTTADEAFQGDAVALLQAANIPLIDDTEDGSSGSGLMHHKFLVIDQTTVITGSANLTSSGLHGDAGRPSSRGNVNHLLRVNSPELALVFRQEFTQMWGDGPGSKQDSRFGLQKAKGSVQTVKVGDIRMDVLFSPHPRRDSNHGLNLLAEQLKPEKRALIWPCLCSPHSNSPTSCRRRSNKALRSGCSPILVLRAAPSLRCSICWGSAFQITPARWRLAISRWSKHFKASAPPALPVATNSTTNLP